MRTIITYGTFDLFHIGHVRILQRAKALGDRLIVGLSTDSFNAKKGKVSCISYENRSEIVKACRYVDLVIPEDSWDQKIQDIKLYNIQTFVMGDDWKGKFDHLVELCNVHYLSRTPGISTTLLKQNISHKPSLISQVEIIENFTKSASALHK